MLLKNTTRSYAMHPSKTYVSLHQGHGTATHRYTTHLRKTFQNFLSKHKAIKDAHAVLDICSGKGAHFPLFSPLVFN
eukprot:c42521_g1_i1 orf=2-229(-)